MAVEKPAIAPRDPVERLPVPSLSVEGRPGLRRSGRYVTEEFLRELEGRRGMRLYREMMDNCPLIGAALLLMGNLLKSVEWWWEPEDEENPDDQEAAEFLEEEWNQMEEPWSMQVDQMREVWGFGFKPAEIIYRKRPDGRFGWRKWQFMASESLWEWEFDDFDNPTVFVQNNPSDYVQRRIPLNKCILFRTTRNKNNPEGRSLLRNAYVPWFYRNRLQEIEAIGMERDLAGMPVLKLPARFMTPDATPAEQAFYAQCQFLVRNVRRDENEGIILPSDLWKDTSEPLVSLELMSTGGTRQVDSGEVITRHEQRIVGSFLADFLLLGQDSVGSFALSDDKTNLFAVCLGASLKDASGTVTREAGERLLRINAMRGKARLRAGDIEKGAIDKTIAAIKDMVASGVIMPDPELSSWARELIGAPKPDEAFVDDLGAEFDPKAEEKARQAMEMAGQPGQPLKPGGARSVSMDAGGVKVGVNEKAPSPAGKRLVKRMYDRIRKLAA